MVSKPTYRTHPSVSRRDVVAPNTPVTRNTRMGVATFLVPMPSFPPAGPVAAFCDGLVIHDLPDLPEHRRAEVVAFAGRRIAAMPGPMRIGVGLVSVAVDGCARLVGRRRLTSFLARQPVPVAGEYVRLVRSLVVARVWDKWPDTAPTGAPLA